MPTFARPFLSLIERLRNTFSHLTRWVEEQQLLEIEALTFNGPPRIPAFSERRSYAFYYR
jgi:hypothetical protein